MIIMIILIQISPLLLDQSLCLRLKQSLLHLKYSLDKSDDHNDLDDDDDGCGDGDDDRDKHRACFIWNHNVVMQMWNILWMI